MGKELHEAEAVLNGVATCGSWCKADSGNSHIADGI